MEKIRFLLIVVFSVSQILCSACTVSASTPEVNRTERNFKVAKRPGSAIPAIPTTELRVTAGKLSITISGWGWGDLATITVTPPGSGPFPLAVISHGNPRKGRKGGKLRSYLAVARNFARRGYKAVIFARRGFGASDGEMREGLNPFTTYSYVRAGKRAAEDYTAVIKAIAKQPDVDSSTVIAIGQSGGGFAVTALASRPPAGLIGVVNFAGGRGSGANYQNHNQEALVGAFAEFGETARVPALWLYSITDRFFWPDLVERMFTAYAKGGAPVRLDQVGSLWYSAEGHHLLRFGGRGLWSPSISEFLSDIGAANWETDPGDTAVVRLPPPPSLGRRGRRSWRRYLSRANHKAFALGPGRRYGSSSRQFTLDTAKEEALKRCQRKGDTCRIVSVDGKMLQ